MKILIPMAGEGKRFQDAGYKESKPGILTYDRRTGKKLPMVICATKDIPGIRERGDNLIFVDRSFHRTDGTETAILLEYPNARFFRVDHLTEGQACTCLLAKDIIDDDEELLIAGCDNGMEFDSNAFSDAVRESDVLVFTYRHNETVLDNPKAYGWVKTDKNGNVEKISVKQPISDQPLEDHAIVATFWYRKGSIFVQSAQQMIDNNDRINQEFYVDQSVNYAIQQGWRVKVFEIDRYICWGTPVDYETYQKTFEYWYGFWNEINDKKKYGFIK